ncbi:hypothetical protein [Granulicella arctica]|uniref:hypothetical protein n=1 Tax=Granulicella arctica TaxID=940613 RepID=UPI0021E09BF5|nr:hypothetical protein [Granulicella arctica]
MGIHLAYLIGFSFMQNGVFGDELKFARSWVVIESVLWLIVSNIADQCERVSDDDSFVDVGWLKIQ